MIRLGIVGAGSFIGRAVMRHLADSHAAELVVEEIDTVSGAWIKCDFSKFDVLLHVAGVVPWALDRKSLGLDSEDKLQTYLDSINAELAFDVAAKAKAEGVSQLIFLSTSDVYSKAASSAPNFIVNTDTQPSPENAYGRSKLKAERMLESLDSPGFSVALLRLPMVYGPWATRGSFASLSKLASKVPVFPRVNNARSTLYTGNLAELVVVLAKRDISGILLPQDSEWACTSDLVSVLGEAQGNHVRLIPGTSGMWSFLSRFNPTVRKVFGNFRYDHSSSSEDLRYQVFDIAQAVSASVYKGTVD